MTGATGATTGETGVRTAATVNNTNLESDPRRRIAPRVGGSGD